MKKYRCSLFFNYEMEEAKQLFLEARKIMGFTPHVFSVYVNNQTGMLHDISYDESAVDSFLFKEASTIQIKNKIYDLQNEDYVWFSLQINFEYNTYSLTWFNNNLDFLLDNEKINLFLKSSNFIAGHCCDSLDNSDQTNTSIDNFEITYPGQSFKTKKDRRWGKIVDTSTHWRRSLQAGGINFLAAPLMWVGEGFYRVISKEKVLKFQHILRLNIGEIERLKMVLFDFYDDPSKAENRRKQQEFWSFFDFRNTIEKFKREREDEIGITDLLIEFSGKKRAKKRS